MGEDTRFGSAKPVAMRLMLLRRSAVAAALLAVGLGSCQGNLGSGTGLTIPQTGGFGQPGVPGQGGAVASRQRALDGAVVMSTDLREIPLPSIGGFSVAIELGTPGPSPAPSQSASGAPAGTGASRGRRPASPSPTPSPTPTPTPSPSASATPSAAPSGKASAKPSPAPTSKPKIVTKTTIYPDDAPAPPTPEPSGDVQTFFKRVAIVRGFLQPAADVSLYGLAAVRFTIPSSEQTANRGFTIAFYEQGKKHHDKVLAYDADPKLDDDIVASTRAGSAIALKKGQAYLVVLYGDEQPSTPGPVPPGYAQPGTNPFVTPVPPGFQQQPGYPQGQQGQPGAYPYPTQTPFGTYPSQPPQPHY